MFQVKIVGHCRKLDPHKCLHSTTHRLAMCKKAVSIGKSESGRAVEFPYLESRSE